MIRSTSRMLIPLKFGMRPASLAALRSSTIPPSDAHSANPRGEDRKRDARKARTADGDDLATDARR